MPRAKKTDPKQDTGQDAKQDALNSLVSGDGGEADDKTQTELGSTAEDTTPPGDQASVEKDQGQENQDDVQAEEAEEVQPAGDPRDAALQGLVSDATPAPDQELASEVPPVQKTGRTVQIGSGKTQAVVAADMYTGLDPEGVTVTAWKGDTVVVSQEKADRGIRLGLLAKA